MSHMGMCILFILGGMLSVFFVLYTLIIFHRRGIAKEKRPSSSLGPVIIMSELFICFGVWSAGQLVGYCTCR